MAVNEDGHICADCEIVSSVDEAEALFKEGLLIGISDDGKEITEAEKHGATITDLSDDIQALTEGEDLSDDFIEKATTIFESAVGSRVAAAKETITEEVTETVREEMNEKVEDRLKVAIDEWREENKVAIEHKLRTEMNDQFIEGLASLFEQHYFQVPEERFDLVEKLATEVEDTKGKLDEEIEKRIDAEKSLVEARKAIFFLNVCEGLADTQKAKLQELASTLETSLTYEDFTAKLETLKESYFAAGKTSVTESSDGVPAGDLLTDDETETHVSAGSLEDEMMSFLRK